MAAGCPFRREAAMRNALTTFRNEIQAGVLPLE
jgi:hypothetical protein